MEGQGGCWNGLKGCWMRKQRVEVVNRIIVVCSSRGRQNGMVDMVGRRRRRRRAVGSYRSPRDPPAGLHGGGPRLWKTWVIGREETRRYVLLVNVTICTLELERCVSPAWLQVST